MANTGYKGYATLEQYYLDDGTPTGVTKPNTYGAPDYVPRVLDLSSCSVGYLNDEQTVCVYPPPGIPGDPACYTVPANTFNSDISKEDANQKARDYGLEMARGMASYGQVYFATRYVSQDNACNNIAGVSVTIFTANVLLGSRVYEWDGTYYSEAIQGFYNIDGVIREYAFSSADGYNKLGGPVSCGIDPGLELFDYTGYHATSREDAYNQSFNELKTHTGRICKNLSNNKWYLNYSGGVFSNVVPEGYYTSGNSAGVDALLHVGYDGVQLYFGPYEMDG